jgi:hypothetical protein
MAYREKIAPLRNPTKDARSLAANNTAHSNQEQFTGDGARTVAVADGSDHNAGNVVQVTANTQDSGTLKDPLSRYQRQWLPNTSNPDGGRDRSGSKVAALATDRERL